MDDMDGLLARIEKLESENRRFKWMAAVLVLVLVVIGILVLSPPRRVKKLEVTELIVKDASGAAIARLGGDKFGTCLELTAPPGASKAHLCTDHVYGSSLDLSNRNSETWASLSAGHRSHGGGGDLLPGLVIGRKDGANMLSVSIGSEAQLLLGHAEDDRSVVLSAGEKPAIRVAGTDGKVWKFPR